MSSNHTENYSLCQWEETDKVLRTDFNEDNAKIDAALAAVAAKVTDRHITWYTTTYTGNGNTSRSFSFSGKPLLVLIVSQGRCGHLAVRDCPYACVLLPISSSREYICSVSWSDRSMSMNSAAGNINGANQTHYLFALLEV